jgi:AcrR family transcriptional regulator
MMDTAVTPTSTEEKIKQAARKLFTQKGFAAVRTRDIAEEAGINLALLNYYFRSKQKLFDLVMMENFRQFLHIISGKLLDESIPVHHKIEIVVETYIDMLTQNPDLPLFILNEIRANPAHISAEIDKEAAPMRNLFFKQLQAAGEQGHIKQMEPLHFIANLVGLTVFPFVGKPILQRLTGTSDEAFYQYMQERKKLIPLWIKSIMSVQ